MTSSAAKADAEKTKSNSTDNPDDSMPSRSSGSAKKSRKTSGFHVEIGDGAKFSKTVSESDVYMFAGITGDFSPKSRQRAVHGKIQIRQIDGAWRIARRLHVNCFVSCDRALQGQRRDAGFARIRPHQVRRAGFPWRHGHGGLSFRVNRHGTEAHQSKHYSDKSERQNRWRGKTRLEMGS